MALALHPGTADFPREVLEFTPDDLAHQLNDAATTFLEAPGAFHVDEAKRVVTLPAPCEFLLNPAAAGDDAAARDVLKTCLRFVGKRRWRQLSLLLNGAAKIEVRFRPPASKCHDALALVRAAPRSPVAAPGPPRTPERAKLEAV